MDAERTFQATLTMADRGHVRLPLPFDPREEWGRRPRHYVTATIAGTPFAGSIGFRGGVAFLAMSAAFRAQAGVRAGDTVEVTIRPDPRTHA